MSALIHPDTFTAQLSDIREGLVEAVDRMPPVDVLDQLRASKKSDDPMSVAGGSLSLAGNASCVRKWLDRLGYPKCRVWGAEAPMGRDRAGCPLQKKLCVIVLPFVHSVPAAATAEPFEVLAKLWFWPIILLDGGTSTDIRVEDLTYTGDPVFENGTDTGSWTMSGFSPQSNYNVIPGLPAIDNSNGLNFSLSNVNVAAQELRGAFIGVSIRN